MIYYTYTGNRVISEFIWYYGSQTCFHVVNSQPSKEWTQYILSYIVTEIDRERSNWKDTCRSKFRMEQPSCLKNRFTFFITLWVGRKECYGSYHADFQVLLWISKHPNFTSRNKKHCVYIRMFLHCIGMVWKSSSQKDHLRYE